MGIGGWETWTIEFNGIPYMYVFTEFDIQLNCQMLI